MARPALLRDQDGFTLLELIVSLGLLALMTTFMVEGLSLVRHGDVIVARAEAREADRTAEAYLRRALGRTIPVIVDNTQNPPKLFFEGGPERMRFISHGDGRLEGGGPVLVDVRIEGAGETRQLLTKRLPYRASVPASGDPVHLLADNVAGVRFRYFGRTSPQAEPDWFSDWADLATLPALVEVTVTPSSGAAASPPLVIAVPAATAPTS